MYRILLFAAAIIGICGLMLISTGGNQTSPLPEPPELRARSSAFAHATRRSRLERPRRFCFHGRNVAPILRLSPGNTLPVIRAMSLFHCHLLNHEA